MMKCKLFKNISMAIANVTILSLVVVMAFGSSLAFAQVVVQPDPTLELFRLRCQIDIDINPVTGLEGPKVQIQGKARADALDGQNASISVKNISIPIPVTTTVFTAFAAGSATADWDTFPDPLDPNPVSTIPGDFAVAGDTIQITVHVPATNQTATLTGECAGKTGAQFKQDTKGQCTLKKVVKGKCKNGDTYTTTDPLTGTTTVHTMVNDDLQTWSPPLSLP